ncbi:1-acyl-sn-glycerol-3-phosphate acyltransferase [Klebsiella pneumoniae subsp. pneumoniae]|nr:1-acyl-sn-glycerol-3-phosphate acyltransferase [Klebsiella pneumoniae subsp. pneumoniae]
MVTRSTSLTTRNNYDMVTASNIVQAPTVTVGKKSLLWIPFFGQPVLADGAIC